MAKKAINGVVYDIGEKTASVYGFAEDVPEYVEILAKVDGKPVVKIKANAFQGCEKLEYVKIPDSVISIGEDAFYNCSALTSVYISSLRAWCNIKFKNKNSNPLIHAGNLHLANGVLVKNLVIRNDVKNISDYAFYGCKSLESVTIVNGITSIGDWAFGDCTSLATITIENSVTSIGACAFYIANPVDMPIVKFASTSTTFSKTFAPAFSVKWDGFSIPLTVECSDGTITI